VDFFAREGLDFSVHAALPSLRYPDLDGWALSPEAHGELLVELLEGYLADLERPYSGPRISTLDALCRSLSAGRGSICVFDDCLGGYLSVGPKGYLYPCQRFCGMPDYRLGNVHDGPTQEDLSATPVWRSFETRQARIEESCGECAYLDFCRGGCPYNVLAANGGTFDRTLRDPHCESYKRFFSYAVARSMDEVFSEENLQAVVDRPDAEAGLLRTGALLSLMREGPHPYEVTQNARRIVAAAALGATGSPEAATAAFEQLGLVAHRAHTEQGMQALYKELAAPAASLNNLYLHVTFSCPLRCTHCYAGASPDRNGALPVKEAARACRDAAELGFRHAVITGGEPLVHPQRDALLDVLGELRTAIKPTLTVLRTSLALSLDADLLRRVGNSTDEVVVSVDGDRATHDARRGAGSYDRTVDNLRALAESGYRTDLSLATVLPSELANGAPGDALRALAKQLGIRRTRFRPVLPLGRAPEGEPGLVPESLWESLDPRELVAKGFQPTASCGMGQNLYVEPDGSAYPCYAWHGEAWRLGSIADPGGLAAIVASEGFQDLRTHTVDRNPRCKACPLRYLCGGACRAWSRQPGTEQGDLDAPPVECAPLRRRAGQLLASALAHLGVFEARWVEVGLPLGEF
jgi:uncharacterized protein